ncbi:hypothetical protein MML48_5g00014519 [Holotrichia oblita]|uniref:Uncharacterized protein n=1 Tax=Holotrichia oblita TaxID=644536 RepID=A0ACB9T0T2_HOLOL|nr:hypothetical protein MML48_5g00014519 [Holotrichia oblita]
MCANLQLVVNLVATYYISVELSNALEVVYLESVSNRYWCQTFQEVEGGNMWWLNGLPNLTIAHITTLQTFCVFLLQMPRKVLNPRKKTNSRQCWDRDDMISAIKAVSEKKMGFLKASKQFSVPRSTLQRLVHLGLPAEEAVSRKLGRKSIMSTEMEDELVHYLLLMEQKFYGLTRNDVRRLAYELCERNGVDHPFTGGGVAGRAWFDHFLNRHKDLLAVLKPTATSFSKANGFNKDVVDGFFDILETEYGTKKYDPDRIFNVDETGLSVVQSKVAKVVGLKGKRQVGASSSAERGSLLTVVCCMSAGGTFVPPMIIFPRKNLMKGAPPVWSVWLDSRLLVY